MSTHRITFTLKGAALAFLPALLAIASGSRAQTCDTPLTLPLDSQMTASTCVGEYRADTAQGFSEPKAVLNFDLDKPATVAFLLAGLDPWFTPSLCLEDGEQECGTGPCMVEGSQAEFLEFLPAGHYRVVVSASPEDSAGACGEFLIANEASESDQVFADGFD